MIIKTRRFFTVLAVLAVTVFAVMFAASCKNKDEKQVYSGALFESDAKSSYA